MIIKKISKIANNKTADTALRLSKYFGNSAYFWMGIQDEFDLREEAERIEAELNRILKAI
jgi:addiction module HigA family antidote